MIASSPRRLTSAPRIAVALGVAAVASAGLIAVLQAQSPTPRMPQGFISGTVESSKGREAGVWVIAQTTETPTPFTKIVVTADDGRFVVPELPNVTFNVWVRGYGLADSKPVPAKPGQTINLKTTLASSPAEAAKVYRRTIGTRYSKCLRSASSRARASTSTAFPPTFQTQAQFVDQLKQGCQLCHQLGNQLTRSLDHMKSLSFKTSLEAWDHRVKTGQRGSEMDSMMRRLGPRALKMYADWTDKIAAGVLPPAPERPTGVERNAVISMWDWGTSTSYMHDEITTSKQNPRVNGHGPVWAVDAAHGTWVMLDPLENSTKAIPIQTRDDPKMMRSRFPATMPRPSNFWGEEVVHAGVSDPHNPMMDNTGAPVGDDDGVPAAAGLVQGSEQQVRGVLPRDRTRATGRRRCTTRRPGSSS